MALRSFLSSFPRRFMRATSLRNWPVTTAVRIKGPEP